MAEAHTGHDMAGQASVTLGARLRKRRTELGWSLEQVESHLKMRRTTLQAIEGERYSELPDKVYALGFIKSYAQFLGLDAANVMEQAERELSSLVPKRQTIQLDLPGPQEGRSAGLWALLGVGLIVIAGGYAGWYHFYSRGELSSSILPAHIVDNNESQPAGQKETEATSAPVLTPEAQPSQQAVAEQGQSTAGTANVPLASPQDGAQKAEDVAKDTPDIPPAPEALPPTTEGGTLADKGEQPVGVTPTAPAQTQIVPAQTSSSPVESGPTSTEAKPAATQSVTQPAVPESVQTQSQLVQTADDTVSIVAHEDSWVQISDATGKVLTARLLKSGETWQGTAGASYRITCGNAGGVVFQAGNVVSAPLGQRGRVVRNLTVDAAAITQGHYGYGSPVTGGSPAVPEGH